MLSDDVKALEQRVVDQQYLLDEMIATLTLPRNQDTYRKMGDGYGTFAELIDRWHTRNKVLRGRGTAV